MKRKILTILSFVCLFGQTALWAQRVESKISSTEMLIGEQVAIKVTAHAKDTARVEFPQVLLLPTEVECIGSINEDDVDEGNGMKARSCSYVLTSFTDADTVFTLPPIQVMISDKVYETNTLPLKLMTVDIDTTEVAEYNGWKYYEYSDIRPLPFSWEQDGWGTALMVAFLFLLLLVAILFLWNRLRNNKPIIAKFRIIRLIPPHQKAMRAIEEIKAERMVTSEDPKQYYTRLTDALRQYINERYGFNAMEMTSSEIIARLTHTDDPRSLEELKQLFQTADLVKFAKYSTMINENDANLVSAIDFINQTKQENAKPQEIIKPLITKEQKRSNKTRIALQVLIGVLILAALAALAYVVWFLYDILI